MCIIISLVGCGQRSITSSNKIDINKLPSWFDIDKEIDKEKAKQLIKAFEVTKEFKSKYADSFVIIGDYERAIALYIKLYKVRLKSGLVESKIDGIRDFIGVVNLSSGLDFLAKAQYLTLFAFPEMPIEKVYILYQVNKENRNLLKESPLAPGAVICDGKVFATFDKELKNMLGITKDGLQPLLDVNAMIEARMKKLGYSPEDF